MPLSDCLHLLRYWAIYAFQLFLSQLLTSQNLKSALAFLRTERAVKMK